MKTCFVIGLALILSACNTQALRQILEADTQSSATHSRLQFDCTATGLFIFEDFPDLAATSSGNAEADESGVIHVAIQRNSASSSPDCLTQLN